MKATISLSPSLRGAFFLHSNSSSTTRYRPGEDRGKLREEFPSHVAMPISCVVTNKCSIMPCMITTVMKKQGREYRTHKRYVDVLVRNTVDGQQIPYAVCWVDGRTFRIDEVIEVHGAWPSTSCDESKFAWVTRYDIRMGHHETEIYQERYPDNPNQGEGAYVRWWVCEIESRTKGTT